MPNMNDNELMHELKLRAMSMRQEHKIALNNARIAILEDMRAAYNSLAEADAQQIADIKEENLASTP